jgi:hypothetical protein
LKWRNLFIEIINQISEFEENNLKTEIITNDKLSNLEKAKTESSFEAKLIDDRIEIIYENMK